MTVFVTDTSKARRAARLAEARRLGTHTPEEWDRLAAFCGRRCVRCGGARSNGYVERDHIRPLYQGGCDCIHNLQPVCARCNCSKGPEAIDYRPVGWQAAVFEVRP